jgi:hypothetical protein
MSSKSHCGVAKSIIKKIMLPNVCVLSSTYGLIKDIAFPKFSEQLIAYNIPFDINRTTKKYIPQY